MGCLAMNGKIVLVFRSNGFIAGPVQVKFHWIEGAKDSAVDKEHHHLWSYTHI
jgi:hypothetical protein